MRLQELRTRFGALVFAREVHPEEQAAHLGSGLSLLELVLPDSFRVQDAAARPRLKE